VWGLILLAVAGCIVLEKNLSPASHAG